MVVKPGSMIVEFYHTSLLSVIFFTLFGGVLSLAVLSVAFVLCINCKRSPKNIDEEGNLPNVEPDRIASLSSGSKHAVTGSAKAADAKGKKRKLNQEEMVNFQIIDERGKGSTENIRQEIIQFGQDQSQDFRSKTGMDLPKDDCDMTMNQEQSENQPSKGKKHEKGRNIKNDRNSSIEPQIHKVGPNKDSSIEPGTKNQSLDYGGQLEMKSAEDVTDDKDMMMKNETKKEQLEEKDFDSKIQEQSENREVKASGHKRKNKEEEKDQHKKKKLSSASDFKPRPLENLGNTCYFNSALQALYQTHILGHLLKNLTECSVKGCPLLQSMLNFYFGPPNPQEILTNVRQSSKRFLGYKQEDSHELIRHLCQGLAKEEKKMFDNSQTVIDKVFRGHVLRLYHCLKCHQDYHLVEQFYDLSLPISFPLNDNTIEDLGCVTKCRSPLIQLMTREIPAKSDHEDRSKSVEVCLEYHTRRDTTTYFCRCFRGDPELDDLPIAYDRSLLIDLPPVLVIHLQRFEQTQYGGFVKCSVPVSYPKVLDLAPYTIQYKTKNLYDLYGVVEHSGTMDFGHYIACIKTRKNTTERLKEFIKSRNFNRDDVTQEWIINEMVKLGKSNDPTISKRELQEEDSQWYYTSDSNVKTIREKKALGLEAILLFYEKM